MFKKGYFDNKIIEFDCPTKQKNDTNNSFIEDITNNLQDVMQNTFRYLRKKERKMANVKDALSILIDHEAHNLINKDEINNNAIQLVEQSGIIFIDEMDKIISSNSREKTSVSREGVQRDILPIIDGSLISTKLGTVNTNNILFLAAGSFYNSKPSDLIPELQGRFPIKVLLNNLNRKDFIQILLKPKNNLIKQYKILLSIDRTNIHFNISGIKEIAKTAMYMNIESNNIGARRLHNLMETLIRRESFDSPNYDKNIKYININQLYVRTQFKYFMIYKNRYKDIL